MSFFSWLNPANLAKSLAGGVLQAITDPITKITGQIADTRVRLAQEQNSERRIELEERAKSLEMKRDVLVAESRDPTNRLIRALMALPVVLWLWKTVVFDVVLHRWLQWSTPELPEQLTYIMMTIIGFYFVDTLAARWERRARR